jgi:hypothetical protein
MKAVSLPDDHCPSLDEDRSDTLDSPRAAPSWRAGLEIAVLASLGAAVGALADVGLPALALAPLLAGLRYGAAAGIACAALQTAALLSAAHGHAAVASPTGPAILGWLIAGLVPGQFCDAWTRRVRCLEQRARDAGLRLGALARAYHVAVASHDRLQRELPGSPSSLRDALEALARELETLDPRAIPRETPPVPLAASGSAPAAPRLRPAIPRGTPAPPAEPPAPRLRSAIPPETIAALPADPSGSASLAPRLRSAIGEGGERILALLRAHAAVRAASLHLVDAAGRVGPAVAMLGLEAAPADDPLLREAVRRGEVVSVRDLPLAVTALVAVPLVDVSGRVHAVVAVHDLPFLFLHHDTLTLFAVLGGHLGDLMARTLARPIDAHASRAFCTSVSRALGEARRHAVPGALAVVELRAAPGEHAPRLLACFLAAQRRVTDEAEIIVGDDGVVRVVVLLALTGAAGLRSYLARLDELARTRARELGTRCAVRLRGWSLHDAPLPRDPRELAAGLTTLLEEADLSSETSASRRRHGLVA